MFWSRLDDAKASVESDRKSIPSPTKKESSSAAKADADNKSNLIYKVSEYMFDLFDANCTDGYKRIDEFEKRALDAFEDCDEEEFTFEQEALHRQFLSLFEELLENFLKTENISMEVLYDTLSEYMKVSGDGSSVNKQNQQSHEIADAIEFYMSFDNWARYMKQQSRRSHQRFRGFGERILDIKLEYEIDDNAVTTRKSTFNESFKDEYYDEFEHRSL